MSAIDASDRRIIVATQEGLPLCPRPFDELSRRLGIENGEILARMRRMLDLGIIRRVSAVPNHYRLGYISNGMSVWDVSDDRIADLGRLVGELDFVSHCYRRARRPPQWPYNLFAMVHGRSREEVDDGVRQIGDLLGAGARGHAVLFSTRILKKTGLRLRA